MIDAIVHHKRLLPQTIQLCRRWSKQGVPHVAHTLLHLYPSVATVCACTWVTLKGKQCNDDTHIICQPFWNTHCCLVQIAPVCHSTTGLIPPGTGLFRGAVIHMKTRAWRKGGGGGGVITPPQHHISLLHSASQSVSVGVCSWVLYYRATCFLLNISSLPACTQQTCSLH